LFPYLIAPFSFKPSRGPLSGRDFQSFLWNPPDPLNPPDLENAPAFLSDISFSHFFQSFLFQLFFYLFSSPDGLLSFKNQFKTSTGFCTGKILSLPFGKVKENLALFFGEC
jgi:hypothetical protein